MRFYLRTYNYLKLWYVCLGSINHIWCGYNSLNDPHFQFLFKFPNLIILENYEKNVKQAGNISQTLERSGHVLLVLVEVWTQQTLGISKSECLAHTSSTEKCV
jgi:hypothetical protein